MPDAKKHSQVSLYPSEVVTIAILFALKGIGHRAFYRWLKRDYVELFPNLPHRKRLFRLFNTHREWTKRFMADPTLIGLMDKAELQAISAGIPMAVFGLSFDMEDVLLRGTFSGLQRVAGIHCGVVEVDWVYNAMPPKPQQIYPPLKVEAVREF